MFAFLKDIEEVFQASIDRLHTYDTICLRSPNNNNNNHYSIIAYVLLKTYI